MIDKLALGTVQLGLKYGINNKEGQVSFEDANAILRLCEKHGIDTIDTAYGYGESEKVLGSIQASNFKVISKLPSCEKGAVVNLFETSLNRLNMTVLEGYMLHNFSIYNADKSLWEELLKLKEAGKVNKIGVSLYAPNELVTLLEDKIDFNIVQVPYNIFDRRFEPYFERLQAKNIEIHTRSSFLQGLFFKPIDELSPYFYKVKPQLMALRKIAAECQMTIAELCLGFTVSNAEIDKVVIGVDSPMQLLDNIQAVKRFSEKFDRTLLSELTVSDETIINPSLWQL